MAVALGGPSVLDPLPLAMIRSILHRSISVLVGAILISACSDRPSTDLTAPSQAPAAQLSGSAINGPGAGGATSSSIQLQALWWKKQHKDVISVAKRIDISGGVIAIPATGLTMVFP